MERNKTDYVIRTLSHMDGNGFLVVVDSWIHLTYDKLLIKLHVGFITITKISFPGVGGMLPSLPDHNLPSGIQLITIKSLARQCRLPERP